MSDVTDWDRLVRYLGSEYAVPAPILVDGTDAHQLSEAAAEDLARLAIASNAFTVALRGTIADSSLTGPARLVSFSHDQFNRNFDVGQEGRSLVFRVRTPATGPNGNEPRAETADVLQPDREFLVVATFDGAVSRIYVDGNLQGRANLAAAGCVLRPLCDAALPFALAVFGGSLAVVALLGLRPRRHVAAVAVTVIAGSIGASMLYVIMSIPVLVTLSPWGESSWQPEQLSLASQRKNTNRTLTSPPILSSLPSSM